MPPAFVLSQNQTLQTENVNQPKPIVIFCLKKPDLLFHNVFLTKLRFFDYFSLKNWNSFINGLIALFNFSRNTRDGKKHTVAFASSWGHKTYRMVFWGFLSVSELCDPVSRIPSETHLRQAADFVFCKSNMLCFAWVINISHIFSLSSPILNFFSKFFLTHLFMPPGLLKSIMFSHDRLIYHAFLHLSNALLRIFRTFSKNC